MPGNQWAYVLLGLICLTRRTEISGDGEGEVKGGGSVRTLHRHYQSDSGWLRGYAVSSILTLVQMLSRQ